MVSNSRSSSVKSVSRAGWGLVLYWRWIDKSGLFLCELPHPCLQFCTVDVFHYCLMGSEAAVVNYLMKWLSNSYHNLSIGGKLRFRALLRRLALAAGFPSGSFSKLKFPLRKRINPKRTVRWFAVSSPNTALILRAESPALVPRQTPLVFKKFDVPTHLYL